MFQKEKYDQKLAKSCGVLANISEQIEISLKANINFSMKVLTDSDSSLVNAQQIHKSKLRLAL